MKNIIQHAHPHRIFNRAALGCRRWPYAEPKLARLAGESAVRDGAATVARLAGDCSPLGTDMVT